MPGGYWSHCLGKNTTAEASRSLMAPNQNPWGLCLLMSWKERADIRSEQGAVNKQTGKAAGTAPHIQKNVRGPLKELEGLVCVDRSVEEETQVAFISVCSPKAAAALPVLCYVLRPRCRALHLSFNLEAKDRMHFKVKSWYSRKAVHLAVLLPVSTCSVVNNLYFPLTITAAVVTRTKYLHWWFAEEGSSWSWRETTAFCPQPRVCQGIYPWGKHFWLCTIY